MMQKPEKLLKPWDMGTHLTVLSESYQMNTNMTGLKCSQKSLCPCAFDESIFSIERIDNIYIFMFFQVYLSSLRGRKETLALHELTTRVWGLTSTITTCPETWPEPTLQTSSGSPGRSSSARGRPRKTSPSSSEMMSSRSRTRVSSSDLLPWSSSRGRKSGEVRTI